MSKNPKAWQHVSRRDAIKVGLIPAGALAAQWLVGCAAKTKGLGDPQMGGPAAATAGANAQAGAGGSSPQVAATAGMSSSSNAGAGGMPSPATGGKGSTPQAGSGAGGMGSPAGGTGGGAPTAGTGGSASVVAGPDVAWATGGTMSMAGGYPDPFAAGLAGTPCTLYSTQTIGPCYSAMPATREDISDGSTGLPLRLSLLVVRGGCEPTPNASVDIWHSGFQGIYSAYAMGTICNPGNTDVLSEKFGRGVLTTDRSGRVDFSTVFPGWYSGRSIHIHFTIRVNGTEEVTSQLYFEDALTDEILAQGEYKARGKRDTTNATDMTFSSGGASPEQVLLATAKRPDGVLHAWKVISIG